MLIKTDFFHIQLLEAKKYKHIQVVTPDWLWSCAERWEHVDERLFPLSSSSITLSNNFPMKESRKDMTTDGSAGRLGRKSKLEKGYHNLVVGSVIS